MSKRKIASAIAAIAILLGTATACSSTNDKRDLEGIRSMDPDYAEVYNNTDGRPNIGLMCVRGVGFATTTRDFTSVVQVPAWDKFCAQFEQHTVIPSQERKNG